MCQGPLGLGILPRVKNTLGLRSAHGDGACGAHVGGACRGGHGVFNGGRAFPGFDAPLGNRDAANRHRVF